MLRPRITGLVAVHMPQIPRLTRLDQSRHPAHREETVRAAGTPHLPRRHDRPPSRPSTRMVATVAPLRRRQPLPGLLAWGGKKRRARSQEPIRSFRGHPHPRACSSRRMVCVSLRGGREPDSPTARPSGGAGTVRRALPCASGMPIRVDGGLIRSGGQGLGVMLLSVAPWEASGRSRVWLRPGLRP